MFSGFCGAFLHKERHLLGGEGAAEGCHCYAKTIKGVLFTLGKQ